MTELPPGWVQVPLGQVAISQLGRMLSSGRETGEHPKPYLRNRDVQWGHINVLDLPVMDFGPSDAARFALQPGDVLVCEGGEVGRAAIWNGQLTECYYQKALHRVRTSAALMPEYLRYLLEYYARTRAFERYTSGSTIAHLPQEDLRNLPILVPPPTEQKRIVAAIDEELSRLDVGVAALGRALQNLKRMRLAAFAPIAESAEGWTTLGEIAEVVGGVTKDAKRQSDPSFVEAPYLRVANVQRGYLDLNKVTTIRVPATTLEKLRLLPGDILFNEGGDRDKLGRGWVWEGRVEDCIHQNHVFRARLLTDDFDPRFISMHGNTFGRTWFEKMGKQTTNLASLSLTTLKSFPIPDLPSERQRLIVAEVESRLSVIDSLRAAADRSFGRANSLRRSILEAAFSGKLMPQDPADEPASVLLERIAEERASFDDHRHQRGYRQRQAQGRVTT